MAKKHITFSYRGNLSVSDWGLTTVYGDADINQIKDPQGASSEITSIPSPFARIDLTKSAFKEVNERLRNATDKFAEMQGNTIYHKLVSDCLDVGELFFNYRKYHNDSNPNHSLLNIIEWSRDNISGLLNSDDKQHELLGSTLNKYLVQDASAYNFDDMDHLYLLQYVGPDRGSMTIIGATSPVTMFFPSANDLSFLSDKFTFGSDHPFDRDYQPLYKRDEKYILFLFAFREAHKEDFKSKLSGFSEYMDYTFAMLPHELQTKLGELTETSVHELYDDIDFSAGACVEVLGYGLKQKKTEENFRSDFCINASKPIVGKAPLILPVSNFTKKLVYTTAYWDANICVPYKETEKDLSKRILPGVGDNYPYLTIGDFLNDYIILNEYKYKKENFFDGNDNGGDGKPTSYLLPVTLLYFKYFTIDDLKNNIKIIRLQAGNSVGVKVTLTIPVCGPNGKNKITYEKSYYLPSSVDAYPEKDGLIFKKRFTAVLYPGNDLASSCKYRFTYIDRLAKDDLSDISFYKSDDMSMSKVKASVCGNKDSKQKIIDNNVPLATSFVVDDQFDLIEIKFPFDDKGNARTGIAIPIFSGNSGPDVFEFSVDFGTTNTHIEYKRSEQEASKPLDITSDDIQLIAMNEFNDTDLDLTLQSDLMPFLIGGNAEVKFPIRTVLSEKTDTDYNKAVFAMASTNIPFCYEKITKTKYNKIISNLKWASAPDAEIKQFISNLMLLMRNKVLMNGGCLKDTKITWFYPTSMSPGMVGQLRKMWKELYKEFFDSATVGTNVRDISEALAPYIYYAHKNGIKGANIVSIDIGGGTSDILFVEEGVPTYLTSIRFAGDSLFNDAFATDARSTNPFITYFEPKVIEKLKSNNLVALSDQVLPQIKDRNRTADEISFFFSLLNNSDVNKKEIVIDFIEMMKDKEEKGKECKFIALVYYASIIYHIATICKAKGLSEPNYISFSGNGSRVLRIILDDEMILADFTKEIYKYVLGKDNYDKDGIEIITDMEHPKEATCKGGLMPGIACPPLNQMKLTLLGVDNTTFTEPGLTYSQISGLLNNVEDVIEDFTAMFFKVAKTFNISENFLTDKYSELEKLKPLFNKKIGTYTTNGLAFNGLLNSSEDVSNTLFFYPIEGIINALAKELISNPKRK